jgi:putative flippase GtrA
MASLRERFSTLLVKAGQYGIVSVINSLVDLAVFSALTALVQLAPATANIFSYGSGTVCGFVLNRVWTFRRSTGAPGVQFVKFVAVNLAALVISTVAVGLMAMVMPAIVAKLLSFPITFAWNFGLSHIWVFKSRRMDGAGVAD